MKKLLLLLIILFGINCTLIHRASVIQLPYLAMMPWYKHSDFGLIPTPINNYIVMLYIRLMSDNLAERMNSGNKVSIDNILYASIEEDIDLDDSKTISKILIDSGIDINFTYQETGCTPVRNLIASDMIDAANFMILNGADLLLRTKEIPNQSQLTVCSMTAARAVQFISWSYKIINQ